MAVAPVPAVMMAPMAVMMVAMPPMAAVMAPMPMVMVAVAPMAGMVAMAEMVVLPLHRLHRGLRGERRRRSRRQGGGIGGAAAEQAAGHQRESGKGEAGAACRGSRHGVTSVHRAVRAALEAKLGADR